MNYVNIYMKGQPSTEIFFLKKGKIKIELAPESDIYMEDYGLFLGIHELLLFEKKEELPEREYSLFIEKEEDAAQLTNSFIKFPLNNILTLIKDYKIGISICSSIAKMLIKINILITKKKELVSYKFGISRKYCQLFALFVEELKTEYKRTRFPWIKDITKSRENSIIYTKGFAFIKLMNNTKLHLRGKEINNFNRFFKAGSTVFKEGEKGAIMYILKYGKLRVLVKNAEIDTIEEPGSVIGEMALLLGGVRSATIEAIKDSLLTIIKAEDLGRICSIKPQFLTKIASNLSYRISHNISLLEEINESIKKEKEEEPDSDIPKSLSDNHEYRDEFNALLEDVNITNVKYRMDWLNSLYKKFYQKRMEIDSMENKYA